VLLTGTVSTLPGQLILCVFRENRPGGGADRQTPDRWYSFALLSLVAGPENMDAMELDMRMRLAELQLKYREKQRELARLQRRSSSE